MVPNASLEEVYEERVARFLELAEAAQEASTRASSNKMQNVRAIARPGKHAAARSMALTSHNLFQPGSSQ